MPETPDRKIEELLRAYAAKRREELGAPLDLHPATRRLLQAEVARLHPRQAAVPATWWNALAALWPRLAFAAGVLAVLGVCLWWVAPSGNQALKMDLAQTADKAKQIEPLTAATPAAPTAPGARDMGGVDRDSARFRNARRAEVADGTSRADLVAPMAPPASVRLQSSPERQVADAPTLDRTGQSVLEKAAARPTAKDEPPTSSLEMAGVAPYQRLDEKSASFAAHSTVYLEDFNSVVFGSVQTNALGELLTFRSLSLAYDPTRVPTGTALWSLNQGGPTQALFGAMYSPLAPEIRPPPGQARFEAPSESVSRGTTISPRDSARYESKTASATGGRASAPTSVTATAKAEPVALSSRIVGQKAAGVPELASGVRYHFVNVQGAAAEGARTTKPAPVKALSSFDFERSGDRVSIADADGSVYEGSVVSDHEGMPREPGDSLRMQPEAAGNAGRENLAAREASKPPSLGRQLLVFRATGTNRTWNQPVVIRGVVQEAEGVNAPGDPTQPQSRLAAPPAVGPAAGQNLTRSVSPGSEETRLRLDGRLRIGTNESTIRAVRRLPEGK